MNKDYMLYENLNKLNKLDRNLPVIFHKDIIVQHGNAFSRHWHEAIELLYFIRGEAVITCNSVDFTAKPGDLIVVNSNELHQGFSISESSEYYCIIFDTSLFQSRNVDACETKYINPISQNRILFNNKVENNEEVEKCIAEFVHEYESKDIGYEMSVKSIIYRLLVLLLRNHVQLVLTAKEYDARMKNLKRFNPVLEYIENHYNEKIAIEELCSISNISRFHFCRLFKSITGKTLKEYLNTLRINKAEHMLKDSDLNVTEVAMACGFDDINYFSRVFKKYKKTSPSSVKNEAAFD